MKGLDKLYKHQRRHVALRGSSSYWKWHHKLVTLALLVLLSMQKTVSVIPTKADKETKSNLLWGWAATVKAEK